MSKKLSKIKIDSSFSLTQQDLFLRSMGFSKMGVDTYLEKDYGPIWAVQEEDGQKYLAVFTNDEGDIIRQALKERMKKTAQEIFDEEEFQKRIEGMNVRDLFNLEMNLDSDLDEGHAKPNDWKRLKIVNKEMKERQESEEYIKLLSVLKKKAQDVPDFEGEPEADWRDKRICDRSFTYKGVYVRANETGSGFCQWSAEIEAPSGMTFEIGDAEGGEISAYEITSIIDRALSDPIKFLTGHDKRWLLGGWDEQDLTEFVGELKKQSSTKKKTAQDEFEVIVVKSDKGYHLMNPHSMYYKGEMTKDILKGLDWTDNLEEAFIFVTEDDARTFADQQGLVTRASKKTAVDIYHAGVEPKYIEMAMDELRYGPEWSFESLSDEQQDTVIDRAKKIKEFKEKTSKKKAQIEEHDLKVLKGMSDEDLYNEIKKRQPKWSDEAIKEEVKRLRDPEFAEWYRDLFEGVREKEGGLSRTAEMSTEEMKEFEERAIESLEKKISEIRTALQKDNIITVQWLFGSLAEIAKDCANELREKGGLGVWASLWNDRRLRPQSLKKKGKWLK